MTTAAPPAPTAEVAHAAQSFNVAAATSGFGVEILFSRFQDLRRTSAGRSPDLLAGASFAAVLDSVLTARARGDRSFDVLAIAKVAK